MKKERSNPIVVTIDGPAGSGKSTAARLVAARTGLPYLDTGAIYRAAAWRLRSLGVAFDDEEGISRAMADFTISFDGDRVAACGVDVTKAIRTREVESVVSPYAARKSIRDKLLSVQREQASNGLVAEGRDMGTVVFPDADLKIFLTASAEVRAERRYKERVAGGENASYDEILAEVNARDAYDMSRETAPLRPAAGCVVLDSTSMTIDEVADAISALALQFMKN